MIVRFHARAAQIIVLGTTFLVTLTAMAQVVKASYVTTDEMHRFVVVTFMSGAGVVLGGLAIVFSMVTSARDREMRSAIAANTDAVGALAEMFRLHHLDADAHPAGSRARIDPLNVKLDKLSTQLTTLVAQHEAMQGGDACQVSHGWDGVERRRLG